MGLKPVELIPANSYSVLLSCGHGRSRKVQGDAPPGENPTKLGPTFGEGGKL